MTRNALLAAILAESEDQLLQDPMLPVYARRGRFANAGHVAGQLFSRRRRHPRRGGAWRGPRYD